MIVWGEVGVHECRGRSRDVFRVCDLGKVDLEDVSVSRNYGDMSVS